MIHALVVFLTMLGVNAQASTDTFTATATATRTATRTNTATVTATPWNQGPVSGNIGVSAHVDDRTHLAIPDSGWWPHPFLEPIPQGTETEWDPDPISILATSTNVFAWHTGYRAVDLRNQGD